MKSTAKTTRTATDGSEARCSCLLCRALEASERTSRASDSAKRRLKRAAAAVLGLVPPVPQTRPHSDRRV